jgi:2-polyprenyl-3-methyl-5-hydroxy-6-metoxy-1,4-benzoquinol methylase
MTIEPLKSPGYARSLSLIRESLAGAPRGVRLHAIGRFLSCPFLRTLRWLPRGGSILDLGGGHGVFARLAIEAGAGHVVVAGPDAGKIFVTYRHPSVSFASGYLDSISARFDAVTLFDVLYRIPLVERDSLYARLHESLRPGGVLLIKELDPTAKLKFVWNRFQELISDNVFRLTLGSGLSYEPPERIVAALSRAGFESVEAVRIDRGYPHSHIAYVGRRSSG